MKKLSAIFFILILAVSFFVYSCSASGGISIGKQQSEKIVKLPK